MEFHLLDNNLQLLLEKIRKEDDQAFVSLAEQYSAVTESAVKRFIPSFQCTDDSAVMIGEDDLRQYAAIALYRAAKTYDPDAGKRKVSFGLYAKICINNALISALRKYKTEKKKHDASLKMENQKTMADPLSIMLSAEAADHLKGGIYAVLSDYEKKVLNYYIVGKSVSEIAERLGKEEKSVSNALYRMRVKVRGLLKNQ